MGFIVNEHCPYLGFSPDGILKKGNCYELLEVKCPAIGTKSEDANEVCSKLKYLIRSKTNSCFELNKKHTYYAQMQLGLFLTDLLVCYLIIYHKKKKNVITIEVKRDDDFCKRLLPVLSSVYFTKMLPFLVSNCNRLKIQK